MAFYGAYAEPELAHVTHLLRRKHAESLRDERCRTLRRKHESDVWAGVGKMLPLALRHLPTIGEHAIVHGGR